MLSVWQAGSVVVTGPALRACRGRARCGLRRSATEPHSSSKGGLRAERSNKTPPAPV